MPLRPFSVWSCTLPIAIFTRYLCPPALRTLCSAFLVAHVPVFVWGIFDIRLGFFCRCLLRNARKKELIALSFDDGPDPALTPEVLRLLERYGAHATFFVVGKHAAQHPHLVRRAYDAGHTIACHDYHHDIRSNFRMTGALVRDIGAAREVIYRCIGRRTLLYRPPVGLTNPHTGRALETLGMQCVGWSRGAGDRGNTNRRAFRRFPEMARGGEIVLLHDILPKIEHKSAFLGALESLLARAASCNLRLVGVDHLLEINAYAPEKTEGDR